MRLTKKWIFALIVALVGSGALYMLYPHWKLIREAEVTVRNKLNDPDSAKFKDVFVAKSGVVVCGAVNAKNGFGGYTGFKQFLVIADYVYVSNGDEPYLPTQWDVACKSAPPTPIRKR